MDVETPIPKTYAISTCKLGQMADCCRYLGADKFGFCCLKHTKLQATVDHRASRGEMNARADNCEGWTKRLAQVPELSQ